MKYAYTRLFLLLLLFRRDCSFSEFKSSSISILLNSAKKRFTELACVASATFVLTIASNEVMSRPVRPNGVARK